MKILTLDQIERMSTNESINAYQNGYRLSDNVEILPRVNTLGHYTASDIGVIAAAIGISVLLLGWLTLNIIRKEEKRIITGIRETVERQGPAILERLTPLAVRNKLQTAERVVEKVR